MSGDAPHDRPDDPAPADRPSPDRPDRAAQPADLKATFGDPDRSVVDRVADEFDRPTGDESDAASDADLREQGTVVERIAGPDASANLDVHIDATLSTHDPDAASVVRKLAADDEHPVNMASALRDPSRRQATLDTLAELARSRLLEGRTLDQYRDERPGEGPLFTPVPDAVNATTDGRSRKDAYVEDCKSQDPARAVGADPDDVQRERVRDYAQQLMTDVLGAAMREVDEIAAESPDATSSGRAKPSEDILDKVDRMAQGSDSRPARPEYQTGDVTDAVGARITVEDTQELARVLDTAEARLGTGDDGRILEVENLYATPKDSNPGYRLISMTVAIDVDERPYTYELQLTTRRASIAADLEHNTIYKPSVETTANERDAVTRMFYEAAALDQEETRSARR